MNGERLSTAPLGEYHAKGACWRCGATRGLVRAVCHLTNAEAVECSDVTACLRRVARRAA